MVGECTYEAFSTPTSMLQKFLRMTFRQYWCVLCPVYRAFRDGENKQFTFKGHDIPVMAQVSSEKESRKIKYEIFILPKDKG